MLKRIVSSKDFKKRFSQNETKRTNTLNTKSEARKSTKEKFSHETDLYDLDFDFVLKSQTHHICVVGTQCGKSSLIQRFVLNQYLESDDPTVEDRYTIELEIDSEKHNIEILDTSGDDVYSNLHEKWFEWADLFIVVYSVTNSSTLSIAENFIKEIHQFKVKQLEQNTQIPMAIVGTQADANDKRSVSREEGESLANKYRCLFFEASSKTGENVNEVFTKLVQKANKLRKKITSVDTKGFSSVPSSRNSVCSIYSTPDPTPSNNNTSLKLKKETSSAWAYDELFMEVVDHCKLEVSHYFENIIESSLILLSLLALSWILGNLFLFSALVIFLLYIYKEPANEGTMTLLKKFFPQQIVIVQNRFGYLLSLINLLINFSTWVVIVGLIGYFRFITFSTVFFLWCLLLGTICIAYFLCLKALRHPDPIEFKFSKPKKLEQKDFNAESCHWLNVWLQSNWIAIAQVFSAELHDQFASSLEEQLKQGTSILPKTVTDLIGIQLIGVGIDDTTCPILTSIHGSPPISGNYVLEVNTEFGGQIFVELELIASVQGNPMSLIRFRIESFSFSGILLLNVESLPRKPFVKRVLVSFKTPPTFKLRTISAMPFEFQGWLQKSLEKMLTNFSYCIFENQMNDEELHQQLELTEELKGTLETIDKILIGDKRKLAQTPDFDDSSYRHKFQNKKSLSSKCDYCKKHGIEWLCRVCGYKCHNHCKSLVHRSEKCSTNLVRFIPILEKALNASILTSTRTLVCQFSSKCIVTSFDNFKKTKQVLTCENYLFNDSLLITTAIRSKNEIVSFIKWSSPSTGRTVDLHYSQNNFSLIIIPPREEIVYQLCFSSQDLTIIEKTVEMFLKKNPVVESPILIENINKLNFDISTFYIDHLSGLCLYWISVSESNEKGQEMKGFTLLKDYEAFEILFEKLSIKERLPPKLPNSNNPVENEKHLKMLSYFLSQIPRTKLFHPPYDTFFTQLKKQSIVNID